MTVRLILIGLLFVVSNVQAEEEEPNLIGLMGNFQYFMQKLHLSLLNGNLKLANFYLHEMEETLEVVKGVKNYHGHPIGKLARKVLEPKLEILEKSIKSKKLPHANLAMGEVVEACNRCHRQTKHGFIKIERRNVNPYFQSFSK